MSKASRARKAAKHEGKQTVEEAQEEAGSVPGGEEGDSGVIEPVAETSEVATEPVADGAQPSE